MRWKRVEPWTKHDTRSPGKSTRMFNTSADASLAARIQQTIQERRMYLSQQRYIREAERTRNQGAANNDHSRSISSGNEFQDRVVQYSRSQNAQSFQPLTSTQDNLSRMTSVNQPVQGTSSISSNYVSRPSGVTPNNRESVSTDQLDLRHELLMEVISQFEKKISDQQNKSFEYSKRRLNSNNGVAFDWGKLPRIGSVHSVRGIIGPKKSVHTSPVEAEESTTESVSRMRNIKMAELARLILNGAFDYYLNPSSPKNVTDTTDKAVGVSSTPMSQGNENDSNQESVTQNQVYDPRGGSSSQHLSGSSAPSKGDYPYLDDRQLELIAKQLIASFNQTHPQATTTPSSNASDSCFSSSGGYPQSNQRAIYNANYDHSSVSQGQPPGVYGRTLVQTTYPRTGSNVAFAPRNNPHIRHFLTSSPMAASSQQAAGGTNGQSQRGLSHNHRNTLPVINRSVRTARVEPLNIHSSYLQPISLSASVNTSSTSNTPGSQQLIDNGDIDHDGNSCLDCKLLGTCPIKKFIEAESVREKEKSFDDSSPNDEEPELIITKVTTKDAERGPIERIDVDEWVSSSASPSEAVRVKQEPVDKEVEVTFHKEKGSDIENTVNQMRLVAEKILNEDNASDSTNFDKNEMERSCTDTDLNANSSQDSITDNNIVDREFITVSEGPLVQDSTSDNDNDNDCTIVDRQTACEVIEEFIQDGVTDDVTVCIQTTPEVTVESSAQIHTTIDTLRLASSEFTDVEPVADICKSSKVLNESDEAATAETPAQTGYGSPGSETGTNENASTSAEDDISNEANVISLDQESRPLIALMKKVTSLEQYLGVSIQSTGNKNPLALGIERESNLGFTPEKEYDKGDRNYEKYVTMEGGGICDQVQDKTVTRRESNDGCRRPSQTTSRQSTRPVKMSLQDKETVERLEKALEINEQKLKNQNVLWIRLNSLKARLKILKRIEKIKQKYDYPSSAEESPINENLETRSIPGDLLNMGGVENAASRIEAVPPAEETYVPLTNLFLGKEEDREHNRAISDSREMLRSTSEETCLLSSPEEMEFEIYKNLKPESQDRFDEAVGKESEEVCIAREERQLNDNGTSVENEVADLDNGKHQDPKATVVSEERQSVVDPPNEGVLENIVIKSEGEQYFSNTEGFSLEDAIKTFAEMSQDMQDENPEDKESASSQTSEEEPIPFEDENQESLLTISPLEGEEPFQTDNLIFNEFQEQVTRQLPKESLSLTNDETFDSIRIREHEVQTSEPSKDNDEIHDLSNESLNNNLESNVLKELNPSPVSSSPLQRCGIVPRPSSTNEFKDENVSFDDNAKSPNSAEKPTLYTCVRKEKRKRDDTEVLIPIKKEKVEANQESSPKEEKSNNIWDNLMSKYSH